MNAMNYWSPETNPVSGDKFAAWKKMLLTADNGGCDLETLLATPYGQEMAETNAPRFIFEEDTMGEECLSFYENIGVRKEMFSDGDFYSRWFLFTPLECAKGSDKKYPLIFWNHGGGNAIETDEFSVRWSRMAGKEKFILVMLQNTCWEQVDRIIDKVSEMYPVDPERVYVTGYSQGGQASQSALLRIPSRLAGAAPCGAEEFQHWDHMDVRYTLDEFMRLRYTFVPVIQIAGVYEFLQFLPVNKYTPIVFNPPIEGAAPTTYEFPGHVLEDDPTNPPGKRADKPFPPKGYDPDRWKMERFNLRMYSLGCEGRDVDRCLAFRETPDDELHHKLGFYGDEEEIRLHGGVKLFISTVKNTDGIPAYRYVGVDNYPHWPPHILADLCWEFLKQFRRDSTTGKIIVDPYKA